jgi:hypothetical protein
MISKIVMFDLSLFCSLWFAILVPPGQTIRIETGQSDLSTPRRYDRNAVQPARVVCRRVKRAGAAQGEDEGPG